MLAAIGPGFPLPILIVQHIVASFQSGFIAWLDRISPQSVTEARDGARPEPGHVYVAPAEQHLTIRAGCLKLESSPPVNGQRPSGTVLLRSMAESLGRHAVGIILTGWETTVPRACWRFAAPAVTRLPKTHPLPS